MIKLKRDRTPIKLNPYFVQEKSRVYHDENKVVWNISWLKEALLELSGGKCAYCECTLTAESKYMEVEHFEDKHSYPDKVLEWENLLPSCKRCNGAKGTHDVLAEPIINPFIDTPNLEMYFRLYRYKGITDKGSKTIDVVNLNHTERAVNVRFQVGEALELLLEQILERIELYEASKTVVQRNKLMNTIEKMFSECLPSSEYAATCATILMSSESYKVIKEKLIEFSLWKDNFEVYELSIKEMAFEMR